MLRSLHPTSAQATGTLVRSWRYSRSTQRPEAFVERLAARLLGADAPAFVQLALTWMRRARYRRELGNLSETQLRDVGLDPAFISRESAKPFWMA